MIRNNRVLATAGSTDPLSQSPAGISVGGMGTTAMNNDVGTVTPAGVGISRGVVTGGPAVILLNNRVSNAMFGIQMGGADKYRDNVTVNVTTPYMGGVNLGNNN
jgi:hypothetical protein